VRRVGIHRKDWARFQPTRAGRESYLQWGKEGRKKDLVRDRRRLVASAVWPVRPSLSPRWPPDSLPSFASGKNSVDDGLKCFRFSQPPLSAPPNFLSFGSKRRWGYLAVVKLVQLCYSNSEETAKFKYCLACFKSM